MAPELTARNFAELTRPHWARMHRFAARLCRDPECAADLVQEALLRALKNCRQYDGKKSIAPWLLAIVRNVNFDQVRAGGRKREDPIVDEDLISDAQPDSLAKALTTERTGRLEEHLMSIPDEFREVLLLIAVEELTYEEAAYVTGAPVGTVRSRLFRARAMLRKRLADDRELFDRDGRMSK
ncbi:MAG: sigma-70 family RNA polymerase sigma factor [Deltaproteobacteria bacterium]|nr:sigma-70 family RNA polymerase sigma factor [Deltaproteobacteria bacterium]